MNLTNPTISDPFVSDLAAVTAGGFNVGDTNHDSKLSLGETWQIYRRPHGDQAEIDNGGVLDPTLSILQYGLRDDRPGCVGERHRIGPIAQTRAWR